MDHVTFQYVVNALREPPVTGLLVDIGSRDVNGCFRGHIPGARYVGIDVLRGRNVQVIASGAALPFAGIQNVICSSVFEHTPHGEAICREVSRVLASTGRFVVTTVDTRWPTHSALDGGVLREGEYYGAVSAEQLRAWLSDFQSVTLTTSARGDVFAVASHMPFSVTQSVEPVRKQVGWTTCRKCNRVLYPADADDQGLCILCKG